MEFLGGIPVALFTFTGVQDPVAVLGRASGRHQYFEVQGLAGRSARSLIDLQALGQFVLASLMSNLLRGRIEKDI